MNILQIIARGIIKKSFNLSVWTIEQFHDTQVYEQKKRELLNLPEGTLGQDIAKCLEENKLRLVPNYESHDLKHVLLDFKMTPVDEIRMQAFMLGNGNYSVPSIMIFIFGFMLLPDLWKTFYFDFKNGSKSKPIKTWTIEDYAHCQTLTLREYVMNYSKSESQKEFDMKTILKISSYLAVILGTFGMIFCLPFLFSANMLDLVGAGFPFVGGAIIASGGLISLSNLTKYQTKLQLEIEQKIECNLNVISTKP
ncbi:hypothetical protein [Sphingobacterium sp. UDSM-2020]|uniref:hypothetical protein n=1 Tax=Sphingobacterium sp. UDSM-2020 TaxID=2795738 RepID=UPI0019354C26|nr:hypothetical protein [Sphingobacterium sp. UDSM-2020]QQD13164.1 hypothetical protein JAZ75_21620 [Sphingobacterium sp. UDSM-2020]